MSVLVDKKRCTECDRCVMCCPVDAICVRGGTCSIRDVCIDCKDEGTPPRFFRLYEKISARPVFHFPYSRESLSTASRSASQ